MRDCHDACSTVHTSSEQIADTVREQTMQTIRETYTTSSILFGGTSNSYYAEDVTRQIVTRVSENAHGEYIAQWGTGRLVDYAGNACKLFKRIEGTSPVFTVVDDALDWADAAGGWAVKNYVSSCGNQHSPFPLQRENVTVCPSCDRFNTLHTELLAYGNLTKCSACAYDSYYSIGD